MENKLAGAIISDDGLYIYKLWRVWDSSKPMVLFVMLNPSKADAYQNDNTITRCISFARSWGYGGLWVGNLFAYRSTDPNNLLLCDEPIGVLWNKGHIYNMAERCKITVCAWGVLNKKLERLSKNYKALDGIDNLHYLQLTKSGHPWHPLYLPGNSTPKPFTNKITFQ